MSGLSFMETGHTLYVAILLLLFILINIYVRKNFLKWVFQNWFFTSNKRSKLSFILYIFAFIAFFLACLDLRGPEDQISTSIPDQNTIILLDTSASMLTEDVRPNRFQKALFLARHFVKNAAGHQVSLILFSDIQKRLVPFTDDYDLLDSRISGLTSLNLNDGGSNLSLAISESISYFLDLNSNSKDTVGNLIIFSDSEESDSSFDVSIPPGINVAFVGIGTRAGGVIPLRNEANVFIGNKTYNGNNVISKLDEENIKKIGKNIRSFKYWIASSYNVPTEEILNFFRENFKNSIKQSTFSSRPVLGHYLIILGIFFLIFSVILSRFKNFSVGILVIISTLVVSNSLAQDALIKKSDNVKELESTLRNGKASREEKIRLASEYVLLGLIDEALTLYHEVGINPKNDNIIDVANYAVASAKKNNIQKALFVLNDISIKMSSANDNNSKQVLDVAKKNILYLINTQSKQDKKDEDKKNNQENKNENQNDNKENENKEEKKEGNKESQKKEQKGKEQEKQDKNSEKNQNNDDLKKNDERDKDKNENEENKEHKEKEKKESKNENTDKNLPKTVEENEKQKRLKLKKAKITPMLKQLLDSDKNLQNKMFDTSTSERSNDNAKKDW